MTFTEIKQRIKDYCNLSSPDADTRVGISINSHYRRITSSLGLDTARYVQRQAVTTPNSAVVTVAGVEKIDRIREVSSGDILAEVTIHQQRNTPPIQNRATTWAFQNGLADRVTVLLDSTSPAAWTLEVDGWTTLADLSGTDEPAFAESYHDVLVWYVLTEEFLKKEKLELAATYARLAEKVLSELRHQLADSHTREMRQGGTWPWDGIGGGGPGGGTGPVVPAHAPNHYLSGNDPVDVRALAGFSGLSTTFLRGDGQWTAPNGGIPGAHAATHQPGGTDPMAVDAAAATGSLRTLGTGALQAARGNDPRFTAAPQLHAPTHLNGGTDPIVVTGLAGYPGGTGTFLRADGSFAAPTGVVPGLHAPTHAAGGGDPVSLLTLAGYAGGTANFLRADGTWAVPPGGGAGGVPGGATTQVQFNDSGAFGGDAGLTYDKATDTLHVGAGGVTRETVAGADTSYLVLSGAGAFDLARSGAIAIHGNQSSTPGTVSIVPGTIAGSGFTVYTQGTALLALRVDGATGHATLGANLVFSSNAAMSRNTADGADNGYLQIGGGGAPVASRGSYIQLHGNEINGGSIYLALGNVAGALLQVLKGDGAAAMLIDGPAGLATFNFGVQVVGSVSVTGPVTASGAVTAANLKTTGYVTIGNVALGSAQLAIKQSTNGAGGGLSLFRADTADGFHFYILPDNGLYTLSSSGQYSVLYPTGILYTTGGFSTVGNVTCGNITLGANTAVTTNGAGGNNTYMYLCGGGSPGATSGTCLLLYGYNYANFGGANLYLSSNPAAAFSVIRGDGQQAFGINGVSGAATFVTTTGSTTAWTFNSTHPNGAVITIYRSDNPLIFIGSAAAIGVGGTNMDAAISNPQPGRALFIEVTGGGGSIRSMTAYNDVTGTGTANCVIESDGRWRRVSSSRRYKTAIEPLHEWRWFLDLEAVEFTDYRTPQGRKSGGFLAEDVAAKGPHRNGLPIFAGVSPDGQPEDVAYANLVAVIQLALKEHESRLAALEQ